MTQQYALVSLLTTISKAQPILVDAAIKGAILLLVAGLFTLAMRRASAAQRHLVWLLALGSTLALPMFSVFLPSWRILPRWACRSATAMVKPTKIESTKIESTRAPQPIVDDPPVEVKDSTDAYRQKRAAPGVTSTNISSPPVPATQPAWWARLDWEQGLMAVWVLGMAALVFRYLLGVTFVRRIGREARPIKDEGWLTVLSDTARSLVIRQSVMLLESPRCVMPMTWGIVGPVVLLPAKTHTWPVERRRVVLSHELAHVKRRDCLAQLIAQTVRAVYWFNPLVWLAWRRMLAESEQACDDLVLTQGSKASDYAEHLLTVASGSKADTLLSPAAIAMARSSQLQMRLLAILDERRNRRKVTRIALAAALLVVIGVVVPLSALRAVEENQGRASQALSPNSASSPRIFNPSAETTGAQTQNQLSASGKVIDLSGEPVAGATVYLREWSTLRSSIEPYDWNDINDILATTRTDQRGQFTFQNVSAKPSVYRDYPYPWDIVAMAKGYGLGWQHLRTPKEGRNLTVLLPTQATISGQVVDKSGKPVSSANVKVFFIDQLGSEYYLGDFNAPGRLDLQRSRLAPGGTTDAEGNVTISGLPEDVRLWLTVEDDNHAPAFPFVATTRVPQPDVRVSRYESDGSRRSAEKVFALRFHAVIGPPEPRIIGRVILADNDEPCSGAKISAFANQYDPYGVRGVISQYGDFAITDPSGRFVLRRISQPQYNIRVEPPSPEYLGRQVSVQVPPEKSEVGVEVKLQRGPMLTGQVMAEQGGQGVAGVNVDLYPQPGGKDSAPNQDFSRSVTSDRDGRFRVAVPVGKGKVSISGPVPGYEIPERNHYPEDSRFVREVDIGADKPIPSLRFSVRRGQLPVSPTGAPVLFDSRSGKEKLEDRKPIPGKVIGSDGKPAAGVEVKWEEDYGLWPSQTRPEITDAGGGFDLRGVEYPTPVAVAVDRQRKLKGHRITVAAPQGEVEIMLKPTGTLTGRVTDGKTPIPGAKAILFAQEATLPGSGANYSGVENAETDATGHYHFDLIEAGRAHLIRVSAEGYTESSSQFGLVVSPGEAVELPTMKLQQANMAVSGIVVDPRGNAVEGVTVSAEDRFTQQEIPLGYQPTTGKDGRFTITVPDLPLRLVAHVLYIQSSGTKPPPIFPAYADVKPGQTDVRIVFDPKVAAVLGKFPPPRPAPVAGKTP